MATISPRFLHLKRYFEQLSWKKLFLRIQNGRFAQDGVNFEKKTTFFTLNYFFAKSSKAGFFSFHIKMTNRDNQLFCEFTQKKLVTKPILTSYSMCGK
jgi:hypothetical protein